VKRRRTKNLRISTVEVKPPEGGKIAFGVAVLLEFAAPD